MSCLLAPSILSFDMTDIKSPVHKMAGAGAQIIHLDVMDGQFVPPITFGADYVERLVASFSAGQSPVFEAHLMTHTPERHFKDFKSAGCERIIYHVEATSHAHRLAQTLRDMEVSAGLAINPGTPMEAVLPILDLLDMVLVMTVNPGWGGQKLIASALEKVRRLRAAKPDLLIEVDGGVTPETLPIAREAGANVFVVGSYLAKAGDLESSVKDLLKLCA
ncbi:MAG TPA: ribulose-phosphate 3-epimerase [Fimbriimonas sp.]|nr:ribulose-phosphate 3-epimerase [Fimbriimonas sp.]